MPNESPSDGIDRREFLAVNTVVAVAALSSGLATSLPAAEDSAKADAATTALPLPEWVESITRMGYLMPSQVEQAAKMGVQVVHTNVVWPYFPLRRDGGQLSPEEAKNLRKLVDDCHTRDIKIVLGLPPFPAVSHMQKHPEWRVHPLDNDDALKLEAKENELGGRIACNLGPWGDYLIALCSELVTDYGVDGFSFDGNYHAPLCFCPACKTAYKAERQRALPAKVDLNDVAYREYLVWRGEKLTDHYLRLQQAIKAANKDAVLMSWTVNAGRYGHFLYSPRAMPTSINRLWDLPMQEWWLDETNVGGSLLPAFGAAYLRATTGDRPAAAEPYLMSRGNPYGTDSFPAHERLTRSLLAISQGNILAMSLGWSGHDVAADFAAVKQLEPYLTRTSSLPWAACLVSEQTRQFYAFQDIAERFLPYPLGVFRAASEEHLLLSLINDWDVTAANLAKYALLVLPNAVALSDAQCVAIKQYVEAGGGLIISGETSLCDELGRPRSDFALADVLGVSYRGRPAAPVTRAQLDENFARTLDENYWKQRTGVARLSWQEHPWLDDAKLRELVPKRAVVCRAPLTRVSEPKDPKEVVMRMQLEGVAGEPLPAAIVRGYGKGRVIYLAAAMDAALWSYAYPYQRRLLAQAMRWVARDRSPLELKGPMCVQLTAFKQRIEGGKSRRIVHLFNSLNTTANHGLPASDVPLREEVIPIHDLELTIRGAAPRRLQLQPGNRAVEASRANEVTTVKLPPLGLHDVLVIED